MENNLDLTIIIVSWNTRELLERCLEAVYASSPVAPAVMVVDNGSQDGSPEMVRKRYPQVILIENAENRGFAAANNQALEMVQTSLALLLNSDAFLPPGILEEAIGFFQADPRLGILGPQLINPDGSYQESHGPLPRFGVEVITLVGLNKLFSNAPQKNMSEAGIPTGWVKGACLFLRRAMLAEIGFFDEEYFFFSEEVDLCARANQSGWKVVFWSAQQVVHAEGGSTRSSAERVLRLYRGKLRYFEKHYGRRQAMLLRFAIQFSNYLKAWSYTLLRWISFGRLQKDALWWEVAHSM